ncbi:MAG: glycosyltransferase [Magnetococcales bacterium]|nr:glycosyltransferase [Magnetococcales bacterium]
MTGEGAVLLLAGLCGGMAFLLLLPVVIYPLLLGGMARLFGRRPVVPDATEPWPTVSLVVVFRNARPLLEAKQRNCLQLDYPREKLQILFCSDGSEDGGETLLTPQPGLVVLANPRHRGKIACLNEAVEMATGAILCFSDVDGLLEPEALKKLLRWFADPAVGGVCGQRVIGEQGHLHAAQSRYIDLDSAIKGWESRLGGLASSDGKLHAVRRELFRPLPEAVADDLFICLAARLLGGRFLFEPEARVRVPLPSRGDRHERLRRRRIVSSSLRGIFLCWPLLLPWRYGAFAVQLLINKVLRRLMPLFLLLLTLFTLIGTGLSALFWVGALPLLSVYAAAACHALSGGRRGKVGKLCAMAWYFCLGNLGMALGWYDYLRGSPAAKWDPIKQD